MIAWGMYTGLLVIAVLTKMVQVGDQRHRCIPGLKADVQRRWGQNATIHAAIFCDTCS